MGITQTGTFDIFDAIYPEYKSKKKVRLIEFFGGIGSQAKALERLGVDFEAYKLCEIDKYAVQTYNSIHGTSFVTSDISEVHANNLDCVAGDEFDYILTYSYPCCVEGTLVCTARGLIPIESVVKGDSVICHDGKWHDVTWSGKTGDKLVYSVKTLCCAETRFTENHKFYVRKKVVKGKNHVREFLDPEFIELKDIMASDCIRDYFCGFPVNSLSEVPVWSGIDLDCGTRGIEHRNSIGLFIDRPDFWWVIGKYVADGWHRTGGGIVISCGWCSGDSGNTKKVDELVSKLNSLGVHCSVFKERTSYKVHITYKEWEDFVTPIGRGAANKEIPQFILNLPVDLLSAFLNGYLAGDGHLDRSGRWNFTTTSEKLAYGLVQVVAKVHHVGASCRLGKVRNNGKCCIEGRTVNYNKFWSLSFKCTDKNRSFYEDGFIWCPIHSITACESVVSVFDLTVDNAHSFVANNCIVHNCTSLSVSGKREGMKEGSGTASSLIWEVKRILKEMSDLANEKASNSSGQVYCLPKILLMENVPQVIDAMNVGDLNRMRDFLESLGYSNHLAIMRGNDYGVPQARHRAFMVSVLGDEENPVYSYNFPVPCGCSWSIRDCMLDKFETKLYERTSVTHAVCENAAFFNRSKSNVNAIKLCGRVNSHQGGRVIDEFGVSVTLTAGGSGEVRVLTRKPTEQADSNDWSQFVGQDDSDFSELESIEEVSDFFFNPEVSENDYSREENFKWDAVVRDGYEYSVRKFMPEETYLIMDFDLEDARKAKLCTSNAQMYKQAGNSIVVNCIVAILGQFFEGKEQVYCDVAKVKPTERSNFRS